MSKPESQMHLARHELLEDVISQVSTLLAEMGVEPDVAEQCGCALADHLANHWGGQLINFPKDHFHRLAERDMSIYNEFTGHNHHALARKWRMTVRSIYRLIDRVHRSEVDRRQPRLF